MWNYWKENKSKDFYGKIGGITMDNMYATYNLKEIKSIVNQAVEFEMWEKRDYEKNWDIIHDLKIRLFDLFGIEE